LQNLFDTQENFGKGKKQCALILGEIFSACICGQPYYVCVDVLAHVRLSLQVGLQCRPKKVTKSFLVWEARTYYLAFIPLIGYLDKITQNKLTCSEIF